MRVQVLGQAPGLLPPVLLCFVDGRGMDHPLEVRALGHKGARHVASPEERRACALRSPAPPRRARSRLRGARPCACAPRLAQEVATRACYLFCRLSKSLRSQLRAHLGSLLPSLTSIMGRVATTPVIDTPANQVRGLAALGFAPPARAAPPRGHLFSQAAVERQHGAPCHAPRFRVRSGQLDGEGPPPKPKPSRKP